jgi:hypothetical protein
MSAHSRRHPICGDGSSEHAMKDITEKIFGVIIAFWLPGFLVL